MPSQVGSPLTLTLNFRDAEDVDGVTSEVGPLDLTGRTLRLVLTRPDGTSLEAPTPEVVGDATDGVAEADVEAGVLTQAGRWKAQGYADDYPSEVATFRVERNLPAPD